MTGPDRPTPNRFMNGDELGAGWDALRMAIITACIALLYADSGLLDAICLPVMLKFLWDTREAI